MEDILIVAIFLFISLLIISIAFDRWEFMALDSILGIWLGLEFMALNFPVGLFMLAFDLWILTEALRKAS